MTIFLSALCAALETHVRLPIGSRLVGFLHPVERPWRRRRKPPCVKGPEESCRHDRPTAMSRVDKSPTPSQHRPFASRNIDEHRTVMTTGCALCTSAPFGMRSSDCCRPAGSIVVTARSGTTSAALH